MISPSTGAEENKSAQLRAEAFVQSGAKRA